jgi:hypothetical protein
VKSLCFFKCNLYRYAERDELIAEREDLTKTVFEHKAVIEEQGHEILVAEEARKILEREIQAKDAQLEQTEKEVGLYKLTHSLKAPGFNP